MARVMVTPKRKASRRKLVAVATKPLPQLQPNLGLLAPAVAIAAAVTQSPPETAATALTTRRATVAVVMAAAAAAAVGGAHPTAVVQPAAAAAAAAAAVAQAAAAAAVKQAPTEVVQPAAAVTQAPTAAAAARQAPPPANPAAAANARATSTHARKTQPMRCSPGQLTRLQRPRTSFTKASGRTNGRIRYAHHFAFYLIFLHPLVFYAQVTTGEQWCEMTRSPEFAKYESLWRVHTLLTAVLEAQQKQARSRRIEDDGTSVSRMSVNNV